MENSREVSTRLEDLRDRRLLVLGGLGFLGRWVVKTALDCGAVVTIIDKSEQTVEAPPVRIIREDILSSPGLASLVEDSDFVIHLAGSLGTDSTFSDLRSTTENNAVATARVVECCLKAGRRAVYPMVANSWLNPYTITRPCAADLGIMANIECAGDFRVLRVMNAYGPWQAYNRTQKLIPVLFRQCMLNKPIDIYGDGNQCVDLIHAEDVSVAFLLACVTDDLPRDGYIDVGTSIPHRVVEVADLVRQLVNSPATLRYVGKRRGEPLHSVTVAKDESLSTATGFKPCIPLELGLRDTFRWYAQHPQYLDLHPSSAGVLVKNESAHESQ